MRLIVAQRVSGFGMAVMSSAVATVLNMPRKDAMACAFCLRWYACEGTSSSAFVSAVGSLLGGGGGQGLEASTCSSSLLSMSLPDWQNWKNIFYSMLPETAANKKNYSYILIHSKC